MFLKVISESETETITPSQNGFELQLRVRVRRQPTKIHESPQEQPTEDNESRIHPPFSTQKTSNKIFDTLTSGYISPPSS